MATSSPGSSRFSSKKFPIIMAAAVRVCVRLRKIANPCSSLQAFALRASCVTVKKFLSSSRVFYSASDEIESNPFYEKYAARIKEVRNEIKEGKL